MRVFRVIGGLVATLLGLSALIVGAGLAALLGPDDTIRIDDQRFADDGVAVVVSEQLMGYYGPTLHVAASGSQPVFIGAAHTTYVQDYLGAAEHSIVHRVRWPVELTMTEAADDDTDDAGRVVAPTELDWWEKRTSGPGEQHLAWTLPDGPYDIVLMRADGRAGIDMDGWFGIEFPGGFVTAVLIALVGTGTLVGGLLLIRARRRPATGQPEHAPSPAPNQPLASTPALSAQPAAAPTTPLPGPLPAPGQPAPGQPAPAPPPPGPQRSGPPPIRQQSRPPNTAPPGPHQQNQQGGRG